MQESETQELSRVQSFLTLELINPKETDQSICFAFSRRRCSTLPIKLQGTSYHPAVHAFSNFRVASQQCDPLVAKYKSSAEVPHNLYCLK